MAGVERRMYRRRRRERRRIRLLLLGALVLLGAAALIWQNPRMLVEGIAPPTPTPAAYNREVVTREVTLPAETWYTIQTGVFSAEESAREKAGDYADRGAPGTVVAEGGKWRVFIASYAREEDAAAVRERLGTVQQVETYLYPWQCPELRLRLTGMAGQLDVAEAGLTMLSSTASLLRDTATLLDAGQLTASEALAAVQEQDGQIRLWTETAKSRFGHAMPEMVSKLLALTEGWATRMKTIEAAADSPTNLSAALKAGGMETFAEMIALRKALSGT